MKYLITICSKEKSKSKKLLPAIKRYLSSRISYVHKLSLETDAPMLILSGKYGLIKPSQNIPYYDQRLKEDQVNDLVQLMEKQLIDNKATEVTFYGQCKNEYGWAPYWQAIEQACKILDIKFDNVIVEE